MLKKYCSLFDENGFDVKICPFSPWRVRLFRRHLRLQDFVESWDWMDIKNFRFCFIQNMKHLQIRA